MYNHYQTNIMPTNIDMNYLIENQLVKKMIKLMFYALMMITVGCKTSTNQLTVLCDELTLDKNLNFHEEVLFNGICNIYDTDILIEKRFYKDGKKVRAKEYYFPSGNLRHDGYFKNDSLSGRYYQYHLNGKVRLKGKFNMGYPNGRWKTYDSSGQLLSIQIFRDGDLINTILK